MQNVYFSIRLGQELRERVLRGTYRVPFYMTRECEMLLRKMLILNPTKRQPLVDVMRDSWLNSGSDNPLRPYVEPAVDQYESDRIEAMVRMGFQRSDIHDALTNQRFNNITATYILLARNNNRTGGRLPCANGGGGLTHVDQSRKSGQPVSRQHSARLPSAINEQQQPATMTVVVPSCGADAGGVPSELVGISTVSSTSTASSSCLIRPATASAEVGAGQSPVIGGNKAAQAGGDLPTMATTTGPRNEQVRRRSSTTTVVTNLTNQQSTPPSPSCSERPGGTPTAGNANSVSPPPSQPPPVETMTASHLASAITIHPKFSASPPPLSSAPLAHEEKEADDSCSSIKVSRRRSSAGSSSVTVVTQNHPTEWKQQQQQPPFPVVNGWKVSDASRSSSTSSDSSSNSCSTAASASLRPGATVLASSPVTVCSVTLAAAPHTPSTKFGIHDQVTNVTPGTTSTTPYATPSLAFTRMGSVRRNPSSVTVRAKEFDAPRCTASPAAATTMPRTAFASATSSVASSGASASRFPRVASTSVQQHDRTTIDSSPGHVERLNALLTAGGGGNTTGEPKSYRHLQAYENAESSVTRTPSCFFRPPPSAADILSDTNPFRLVVPVAGSAADHSPACTGPPSIPPHKTRAAFAVATPTGPIQTFSPNSARHQQTSDSQPLVATANSAAVRRPTAPTPPPLAIPLVNNQTVPSRNSYLYHSLRLPSSTCSHNVIEELVNSRHSCNRDARKPSTLSAALPDVYTPVPFVRNLPERSTIQHVPSGRARQRLEEAVGTTGRLVRHAGRQSIATHSIRLRANPLPTTSITTVKNDSSNATSHNHFCSNAGDEDIDDADLVVVTPRAVSPIDADTISLSSDSTAASSTSTSMSTLAQHQQHSAAVAGASRFRRQDMSPDRSAPLAAAGRQHRSLTKPVRGATVGRGGSSPPTSSQQQPMHRHYSMRPASGSTVNSSNVTKSPGTIHGERTVGGGAGINHFFRTLTTRISRSRLFRRSTIIQTNNGYSSNNEYAPGLDVSPIVAHSRHDPKMAPTFELDKVVALTATAREASPSSGPTGMLHAPVGGGHMPRSRSGVATTHHQLQRAGFGLANPVDRGAANELSSSRTQADFTEAARTSGTRRPSQRSFRTPPGNGPAASTATQTMKTSSHCNLSAESREQHPSRFTPGNDDNHGRFPKSEEASYLGGSNRVGTHQSMRYVLRSNSTHFSLQDVMMDVQQSLSKHGVDFELIGDMKLHCVYGDPSQDCRVPTLTNGMKNVKQMLPPSGDAQNLNDSVVHWEMEIGKLVGVSVNGIRFKRINGPMHILRHIVNKIASDMKL